MDNTLFLRLEGPLQAWGERARWSVRDSAPEPTKSGVVGLLGCALGLSGDEGLRELSRQIRLGIRCDRPGVALVDYHTVMGTLNAQGKLKISSGRPHTEQTWRTYLCDASFLAAVQSDDGELVERLAQAVQSPHWPVFLGRKSCPPARPLYEGQGDFPTLADALAGWPYRHRGPGQPLAQVRAVLECLPGEGVRRRDELLSRSARTFASRYTREISLTVTVTAEEA